MKESEHQKIYAFVLDNKTQMFQNYTTDRACVAGYYFKFNREKSSTFSELQLKATIAAAYIEVKNML